MISLPPDNAPAPLEGQPDRFVAIPPPGPGLSEPMPEFRQQPDFEAQPLPDPAPRVDARAPFRWIDLLYLMLFYFIAGAVLTLIVAAGAVVFFGISPTA